MSKRRLFVIKVGSDEHPARTEDIRHMKKMIKKLQKKNGSLKRYDVIVTHHAVDFDFFRTL